MHHTGIIYLIRATSFSPAASLYTFPLSPDVCAAAAVVCTHYCVYYCTRVVYVL